MLQRTDRLLLAGAALGLGLAAWGIAGEARPTIPSDAVAVVNGRAVRRTDYRQALGAVASDRRIGKLQDGDRERILNRLIEEELLLQRALELGLDRSDPRARSALTSSLIGAVVQGAERSKAPTDAELREHHRQHADYFAEPRSLRVRVLYFPVGTGSDENDVRRQALDAARRLRRDAGLSDATLGASPPPIPVPNALLPPSKLLDYLGPTATRSALELVAPGDVSDPVRGRDGFLVVRLVERQGGAPRPFDQVRDQVKADYVRRAGERRLAEYLADLRAAAEVRLSPDVTPR